LSFLTLVDPATGTYSSRLQAAAFHDLGFISLCGPQAARDKGLNCDLVGGYGKTVQMVVDALRGTTPPANKSVTLGPIRYTFTARRQLKMVRFEDMNEAVRALKERVAMYKKREGQEGGAAAAAGAAAGVAGKAFSAFDTRKRPPPGALVDSPYNSDEEDQPVERVKKGKRDPQPAPKRHKVGAPHKPAARVLVPATGGAAAAAGGPAAAALALSNPLVLYQELSAPLLHPLPPDYASLRARLAALVADAPLGVGDPGERARRARELVELVPTLDMIEMMRDGAAALKMATRCLEDVQRRLQVEALIAGGGAAGVGPGVGSAGGAGLTLEASRRAAMGALETWVGMARRLATRDQ
jgi:hypothetical protein